MHLGPVIVLALVGIFLLFIPAIGFLSVLLVNYFRGETPTSKTTLL
jgi:hypothetical protein